MSSLKSLELAIEVAVRRRDLADEAWQQARRAQQHAQGQLDQLVGYADDTEARWSTAAAATVNAEVMSHHRNFMQRLRHAIELQTSVLGEQGQKLEVARLLRVQQEVRLKALEHLRDQKLKESVRLQARREQKDMDELAARQFARHGGTMRGVVI